MTSDYGLQAFDSEIDGFESLGFEQEGSDGFELEGFDSFDSEGFDAPALQSESGRLDAETASMLMDMYADMAAAADSEEEADAFLPLLGALAPLAMKAMPMVMGAAKSVLPGLAKGVMAAGKKMLAKAGPQALRALPNIARGVARDSLGRVARGQHISGQQIMRSAAQHTLPYLQDPRRRQAASRRCRQRALHARRMLAPPGWAQQRASVQRGYGVPYAQGDNGGGGFGGGDYGSGGFAGGEYGGGGQYGGEFGGGDGDYAGAGGDGELY